MHIKNFKAFADSGPIVIKPITLFCGTNSCGKSTLLQSILLWKQSIESRNYDQSILMNGKLIHLGTYLNLLHGHDTEAPLSFEFIYGFTRKEFFGAQRNRYSMPLRFIMQELLPMHDTRQDKDLTYKIKYGVELGTIAAETSTFNRTVLPRKINLHAFALTPEGETIDGAEVQLSQRRGLNDYTMVWKNIYPRHQREGLQKDGSIRLKHINFINLVPTDLSPTNDNHIQNRDMPSIFYRLGELLRYIYGSLTYLGPLREEPARRYIYEDEVVEIGVKGENAAYIYMAEGAKQLNDHYFYAPKTDNFEKIDHVTLQESVNLWFGIMGIHSFSACNESEIIRLDLSSSRESTTRVNIADVGFGVSQIFPIILEGLRMDIGQTLLLEQPEIHLHPRLQMQLADYIVSLALSGKRVILETHSDHIVNRLVRRMAEDSSGELAKLMGVYFVSQSDHGSSIEEVFLDPKQGIINWPEDFFDQAAIEQQRIMSALIANRKKL